MAQIRKNGGGEPIFWINTDLAVLFLMFSYGFTS